MSSANVDEKFKKNAVSGSVDSASSSMRGMIRMTCVLHGESNTGLSAPRPTWTVIRVTLVRDQDGMADVAKHKFGWLRISKYSWVHREPDKVIMYDTLLPLRGHVPHRVVSATITSSPRVRILILLLGHKRLGNTDGATLLTFTLSIGCLNASVSLAWTAL